MSVSQAAAQQVAAQEAPRWDAGFTAGLFLARPEVVAEDARSDDWYGEGRYAASLGYYWTEGFKTEVGFAHSGEGRRYVVRSLTLPNGQSSVYGLEEFHRLQQASARAVWQFRNNEWVTPYLSAGIVLDLDRVRVFSPPQYQWPVDPRTGLPTVVRGEINTDRVTNYRAGAELAGGAKFYMTPRSYINTGAVWTYSRPATTVSFIAGLGLDF